MRKLLLVGVVALSALVGSSGEADAQCLGPMQEGFYVHMGTFLEPVFFDDHITYYTELVLVDFYVEGEDSYFMYEVYTWLDSNDGSPLIPLGGEPDLMLLDGCNATEGQLLSEGTTLEVDLTDDGYVTSYEGAINEYVYAPWAN